MLSQFVIFFLALLGSTIAADGTQLPNSSLTWTGEVAGHGKVTLHGDASSVEEQIFALNPSLAKDRYDPTRQPASNIITLPDYEDFDVFDAGNSTYRYTSPDGLATRDDVNGEKKVSEFFRQMDWYCATFATGNVTELPDLLYRVGAPGGLVSESATWSIAGVPGGTNCERLACAETAEGDPGYTAIYWCNDSGDMVTTAATNLVAAAASIAKGHRAFNFAGCCLESQTLGSSHAISGQMHLGNGTNINIGYGDCPVPWYFTHLGGYSYPGVLGYCS
ncbi:hypothetical protein DHEL01_v202418 [Diaporthe helianthi]|uniref:Uncharacterized protein n=1 Tax=Diaporthe helianthi TaxID=158607 RepID=A0A2P5I9M3_DIAHE|nr:hypothetical protein DHEL01_v202418 [Diaporthe helianthi]